MARLTIGLLINELDSYYTELLVGACSSWARRQDVNLLIFAAESLKANSGFRYQHEVLRSFIRPDVVDALVAASGTQCLYASPEEFKKVLDSLDPVKSVSIGIEFPGIPSVLTDGATGIASLVEHLVQTHGKKRLAFLGGPENNPEACERLKGYQTALAEQGLIFDPHLVFQGGFDSFGANRAWDAYFEKHRSLNFDALICANDDMAMASQEYFARKGIMVPQDLAITGFDDVTQAEFQLPPLTTIRQPMEVLADKAMTLACELAQGKSVQMSTHFAAQTVIRASCGCIYPAMTPLASGHAGHTLAMASGQNGLKEKLSSFVSAQLSQLGLSGHGDAWTEEIERLTGILVQCPIRNSVMESFVHSFLDFAGREVRREKRTDQLQGLLLAWINGNESLEPDPVRKTAARHTLEHCRMSIAAMSYQQMGREKDNLRNQLRTLRYNMERLISVVDVDELIGSIHYELSTLKISSCCLVRYEPIRMHHADQEWEVPDRASLLLAYQEGRNLSGYSPFAQFNPRKQILPANMLPRRRFTLILDALYFRTEQLGYLLVEAEDLHPFIYQTLHVLLSNTINVTLLFQARRDAEERLRKVLGELENTNQRLARMSQTDELTGLFNRRGFMNLARQNLDLAQRMDKSGLLFYADLDGLKKVNDTWGHGAGDELLKGAADVLRRTFRGMDVIARIGGDEFAILAVNSHHATEKALKSRLQGCIKSFNKESGQPFQLGLSLGAVAIPTKDPRDLEFFMEEADSRLYEQKRKKKAPKTG